MEPWTGSWIPAVSTSIQRSDPALFVELLNPFASEKPPQTKHFKLITLLGVCMGTDEPVVPLYEALVAWIGALALTVLDFEQLPLEDRGANSFLRLLDHYEQMWRVKVPDAALQDFDSLHTALQRAMDQLSDQP